MNAAGRIRRAGGIARVGMAALAVLFCVVLAAPFLCDGRPLFFRDESGISFPFAESFFSGDAPERRVDQLFNYLLLFFIASPVFLWLKKGKTAVALTLAILLAIPFFLVPKRIDKRDWREWTAAHHATAVFAPIPFGPFETAAEPYLAPSREHLFGTDEIGRDAGARLIYGARVSLAVGVLSTLLALFIGAPVGLVCGYCGGKIDLFVMRLTEILLCFPSFLLLLILLSLGADARMEESLPLLIAVIGATGWIGFAVLARGETLHRKNAPYIESCRVSGVPVRRILFNELLPNVGSVLLIAFPFAVAGAILAESSLSFLGFGVRPPTASWGNLLRQAFDNPLEYRHLMIFPGAALFWTTLAFHFTGEGLRRIFAVRE
ncbi:MAG: ABC transporter permease [Victivallaceae bacterium]|nr:ABC transporter permease [Victivallaceae bacterium]